MKLPAGLRGARGVVIDTNVFVYLFEDHPEFAEVADFVVGSAAAGAFHGVVTPITAAEILVKPLRLKRADIADRLRRTLRSLPNIEWASLSAEAGFLAGALRAAYGLPLPDMLQVATAMQSAVPCLITNDKALQRVTEVRTFLLTDFQTSM